MKDLQITKEGKIYHNGKEIKQRITTKGLCSIRVNSGDTTKEYSVGLLVYNNFNSVKAYSVVHIDGNNSNNHLDNLKPISTKEKPIKIKKEKRNVEKVIKIKNEKVIKEKVYIREYSPLLENEIFIDCYGFPMYEVSNMGNVRNKTFKFNKKLRMNKQGYSIINLYLNDKCITSRPNRLVMMSFNPVENMENLQVNHIDGNRTNNKLNNLEWSTPKENNHHRLNVPRVVATGTPGILKTHKGKFEVRYYFGSFDSFEEARDYLKDCLKKLDIQEKYLFKN